MIPYIRAANVKDGRLEVADVLRMNFTEDEQLRFGLRHGDVLVTEGCGSPLELGASAQWRDDLPGVVGFQNHVLRLRSVENISDSDFLLAVARWCHHGLRWLEASSGTSILNISLGRAQKVLVPAPPFATQRAIGAVLRSFDEAIEINERRIEVLEDLARSLYREWFVHLRFPGHESVDLVDSDLGPIPEGWDVGTLGGIARWYSGGTPSTKNPNYWDGSIPWITSGSLTSMLLDSSERRLTDAGLRAGSRLVERDTVLFVVRGMSLVREFRVGLADSSLAFGQDCKALVANTGTDPLFLAFTIFDKQSDIQAMVELAGHGTGKLSTDRVKAVAFPLPPEQLQLEFASAIRPIRELMSTLVAQTRTHRGLRDLLLPRLVTGQLDISDIDLGVLTPPEAA